MKDMDKAGRGMRDTKAAVAAFLRSGRLVRATVSRAPRVARGLAYGGAIITW
jgi:hypothetical protein